ncbi:MAG TPA: DUF1382 family protein [Pseudomonas sp.]|uniref:DUF1382 family protein n=1 Tax=Pseudomonas sp. TaxID=306 RepID=UPI002B489697|nr:DUF1382 family protein [Pseudomonas sp.]HKS12448.1 DUF1382 family protein [Pseudomonas sp.]
MKRATPIQLRNSLQVANAFVKHGIHFVCMPVVDEADHVNLASQAAERLERMAVISEAEEQH